MVAVKSTVIDGKLVDITYTLQDKKEIDVYRKLIATVMPECPLCGEVLIPDENDCNLVIHNPLQCVFGIEIGTPVTNCTNCKSTLQIGDMADLSAFPSVIEYLSELRKEYKKRAAQFMSNNRGGK